MNETVLLGEGRQITKLARKTWEGNLSQVPQHSETRLGFMSREHHLVRHFVVRELPSIGKPLQPDFISRSLKLPIVRVNTILEELEKNLFFLVRNSQGAVTWAFPITVEKTPHKLTFNTGERLYSA